MLNKSLWFSFFVAIFVALLLRTFVFSVSYVPADTMIPTLYPGDYVMLNHWVFREDLPKRGDVIVYTKEDQPGIFFVKRVVGLEGDEVETRDGFVFINQIRSEYGDIQLDGNRLEKLLSSTQWHWVSWSAEQKLDLAPINVPQNYLYVLADSRSDKLNRPWDRVPLRRIKARVDRVLFSLDSAYKLRWDRVLKSVD
ncbi:MAG: signal peptidase I [Bdellovibrionota bacterium]